MMNDKNLLGLTIKYPEKGKVKTRLAKDIGFEAAAAVYKRIAERVVSNTRPAAGEYERIVYYSPCNKRLQFERWFPGEKLMSQKGGDIGEIMCNALESLFELGAQKAVITGADIPELGKDIIKQAFLELEDADIVIGPAIDGGYYLIGMKSPRLEVFHGISWGTDKVFQETVSVIERLGLSFRTVAALFDVDRWDDLLKFNKRPDASDLLKSKPV